MGKKRSNFAPTPELAQNFIKIKQHQNDAPASIEVDVMGDTVDMFDCRKYVVEVPIE